ncbi:alpha/beta hydrolase [Gordonia sp. PKS22-38]|uniref:Alpha/beta hydrolase n=1 Tax=Gordonia prachuapensis TaxID=3115651 RepID=A0ABU7MYK7_9ACTN|nr:alpha/beta hydrolase [Gordonia sp. PKS22-38]
MRPTISELRQWQPDAVTAAGADIAAIAELLSSSVQAVGRVLDDVRWLGATHDAVVQHAAAEQAGVDEARKALTRIADEAALAGAELASAREWLLREIDGAVADGFVVTDHGTVTDPAGRVEQATVVEARILQGISMIDAIDERHGARLEQLVAALADTADTGGIRLPDGRTADPERVVTALTLMTPRTRREFLSRLTDADRRQVMLADPHIIGNLDGVDFELRAAANDVTIRAALDAERTAGRGDGPRARRLEDFLRPLADGTRRRFIAFDPTGHGHFIEMVGELGPTIRNAAILVPGTGADLDSSATTTDVATELARATGGPVLVYLDGDLPLTTGFEGLGEAAARGALLGTFAGPLGQALGFAGGVVESVDDSAVDPRFAREMAPDLVAFAAELDAEIAETAPGAATTVIGHSYGGSVVGSAEQLGLRADRVIYASSAGTGVFDGPWRNPNPEVERYSMTAPGDPIHLVQSLPGNPHGDDPDTAPGVHRMDTGLHGADPDGRRTPVEGIRGHGDYWQDPASDAFRNVVAVILGEQPTPYPRG